MSGGSMNYLYSKLLHCADFLVNTPEREAFANHLKLVAQDRADRVKRNPAGAGSNRRCAGKHREESHDCSRV